MSYKRQVKLGEVSNIDLRMISNSILGIVSSQMEGISSVSVEYNRGGALLIIVSLDDLELNISYVKECVLGACELQGLDPMGIYLDI